MREGAKQEEQEQIALGVRDDAGYFKCKFCRTKFSAYKAARECENSHTGKLRYYCTHCGNNYANNNSLLHHIQRVHEGKEGKKKDTNSYICRYCTKHYDIEADLQRHKKDHKY